jgi:uracil-DNA glycosylase family protein
LTPTVELDVAAASERALRDLAREAQGCQRCPLYRNATQTVFGEGPRDAPVVLVGEQPGDQEDIGGRPFIGPAGRLLDKALARAGVDRGKLYLTNAVKHYKNEPRGKRRLHKKPNAGEVEACKWWLEQEIEIIRPRLLVALGATGAAAVAGRAIPIMRSRGRILEGSPALLVTIHPSYLLRMPDRDRAEEEFAAFAADLGKILVVAPETAAGTPARPRRTRAREPRLD